MTILRSMSDDGNENGPRPTVDMPALFARHRQVFVSFSGGKESIVCAHLCEPWRERVTLLWADTGAVSLPHMGSFVREFAKSRGFELVEIPVPDMLASWDQHGLPADIMPTGLDWPKLEVWTACCFRSRTFPIYGHASRFPGAAVINGQRFEDQAFAHTGLLAAWARVEIITPLWHWSERDVFDYIERHKLPLPSQYEDGWRDSGECALCPASISKARLAYLDRVYPAQASFVRQTALGILTAAQQRCDENAAVLGHRIPSSHLRTAKEAVH